MTHAARIHGPRLRAPARDLAREAAGRAHRGLQLNRVRHLDSYAAQGNEESAEQRHETRKLWRRDRVSYDARGNVPSALLGTDAIRARSRAGD
jgi:hypothetical protein